MKRYRNARAPALLAALCLALAGCGEALGSEPVVVNDNSPSYVDGVSSAPGKDFAALAGAATTEAGTVYLDVTDEMYATGRYGEKPDGAGCISAAQAADLAAGYAAAFASYGLDQGIWKLDLENSRTIAYSHPVWSCTLSLPAWSSAPQAIPDEPALRALTPEQLAELDDSPNYINFLLAADTGELLMGTRLSPREDLDVLAFHLKYPREDLLALNEADSAWLVSEDAMAVAGRGFETLTGAPAARLTMDEYQTLFIAFGAQGRQFDLMPCRETGLLRYFSRHQTPATEGGPS